MEAKSILYVRLTKTEIKSINLENKSEGGSSQTYIDIPKGQVSDDAMNSFFGASTNGIWNIDVYSLGMSGQHQQVEIYSRRDTTNSIRNQTNNRIYSWNSSDFPSTSSNYDEKENPVVVYFIKEATGTIWAGWFFLGHFKNYWFLNIDLAKIIFSKDRAGLINLYPPVRFTTDKKHWPFIDNLLPKKQEDRKDETQWQIIYYGAPGTGKSYKINDRTKPYSTIRTTFHPDSDYSTFVGVYKPTMEEMPVFGAQGVEVAKEKRITYTFVKQAFLKAYLGAWQKYAKGGETVEPQFLVIEEINRGNCAQIFGDLFQLLDRSDNGFSTYPIDADSDLQKEIREAFADGGEYALESELVLDDAVKGYTSNYGKTLSDDIKSGRVVLLPNNLYIWATMNTSDQSLFPIDSAFKRRWDWQYVKITDAGKGWKIKCGDEYCDWWTFIEEINKKIAKETSSDDKKLGYFFCNPSKDSDTITEEMFVGKVLFYLWNDVFKDGDITLFKVNDDPEGEICFDAFYTNDNKVNVEAIRKFLVNVVGVENLMTKDDADDEALEALITGGNVDRSQYTFNGTGKYGKSKLGHTIVDKYLSQHKNLTFDQIKQTFPDSMLKGVPGPGLIVKEGVDLGSYSRYYKSGYTSSDGIKYLIYKQWTIGNIQNIIEFAKKQNWSVEKL